MTWKIKPGWEHRAFLGVTVADDAFAEGVARVAEEQGWLPEETKARTAYYEHDGTAAKKES